MSENVRYGEGYDSYFPSDWKGVRRDGSADGGALLDTVRVTANADDGRGALDKAGLALSRYFDRQMQSRYVGRPGGVTLSTLMRDLIEKPDADYDGMSRDIDAAALRRFHSNADAQSHAMTGLGLSFGVQLVEDGGSTLEMMGEMSSLQLYPAARIHDALDPGNPTSKWVLERNRRAFDRMGLSLSGMATFVNDLPGAFHSMVGEPVQLGNYAFNNGNYTEAFYHYGKVAYPILMLTAGLAAQQFTPTIVNRVAGLAVRVGVKGREYSVALALKMGEVRKPIPPLDYVPHQKVRGERVWTLPQSVEGVDYFRFNELVNIKNMRPVSEFDTIDLPRQTFFEDKTARGFDEGLERVPEERRAAVRRQRMENFFDKHVLGKTQTQIEALARDDIDIRPNGNKSGTNSTPTLDQIRGIRKFVFYFGGNDPMFAEVINRRMPELRNAFPDYSFDYAFNVESAVQERRKR